MVKKPYETTKAVDNKKPVVIDFGTRAVSEQNFSKIVALPKQALANCGIDMRHRVRVQLVQEKEQKYIRLTPAEDEERGGKAV